MPGGLNLAPFQPGATLHKVAKAPGNYAVTFKSIDLEASIKKAEERVVRLNGTVTKMLDAKIVKILKSYIKASDGSKDNWDEFIRQAIYCSASQLFAQCRRVQVRRDGR